MSEEMNRVTQIEIDVTFTPEEVGTVLNVINNTSIRGIQSMKGVLSIVQKLETALEEKGLSVMQASDAQMQGRVPQAGEARRGQWQEGQ